LVRAAGFEPAARCVFEDVIRMSHNVLMARAERKVKDRRVLRLIRRFLRAGVMVSGIGQATSLIARLSSKLFALDRLLGP
jgi:hypothetical protein